MVLKASSGNERRFYEALGARAARGERGERRLESLAPGFYGAAAVRSEEKAQARFFFFWDVASRFASGPVGPTFDRGFCGGGFP